MPKDGTKRGFQKERWKAVTEKRRTECKHGIQQESEQRTREITEKKGGIEVVEVAVSRKDGYLGIRTVGWIVVGAKQSLLRTVVRSGAVVFALYDLLSQLGTVGVDGGAVRMSGGRMTAVQMPFALRRGPTDSGDVMVGVWSVGNAAFAV